MIGVQLQGTAASTQTRLQTAASNQKVHFHVWIEIITQSLNLRNSNLRILTRTNGKLL